MIISKMMHIDIIPKAHMLNVYCNQWIGDGKFHVPSVTCKFELKYCLAKPKPQLWSHLFPRYYVARIIKTRDIGPQGLTS